MKKICTLASIILFLFCTNLKLSAQMHHGDWKEMEDFHEIMAIAFHSAEGDLFNPLKENSELLVSKAQAWKDSAIPVEYNKKMTAKTLSQLVKQCKKVDKMVKKGASNEDLMAAITKAHDIFHNAMDKGKM